MILTLALLASPSTLAAERAGAEETEPPVTAPVAPPPEDGGAPIINGDDADTDDFPMTGGMLLDADLEIRGYGTTHVRMFVCSSTLIAPDVVLLAAHCIDPDVLTYGYGTVENTDIRWTRQADLTDYDGSRASVPWPDDAVKAADWIFHPDWDYTSLGMGLQENNDLALLFLEEPIFDVPFAYLASEEEAEQIEEGLLVDVVGWGQQEASDNPYEAPPAGTYAIKMMGESYINELNNFEMQIGGEEEDVRKCHGDSGGPTFLSITTETVDPMRLIGVTSHAYDMSDCAETGGVDTRVDHYLDWIDAELRARCEDGSRAWCDEQGIPVPPLPEAPEEEEEKKSGCACDSTPTPLGGLFAPALVLAALARRRRAIG